MHGEGKPPTALLYLPIDGNTDDGDADEEDDEAPVTQITKHGDSNTDEGDVAPPVWVAFAKMLKAGLTVLAGL